MIYFFVGGFSTYLGLSAGLGSTTLLRPLLDAVSPLSPSFVATLCAVATLAASLVSAIFVLSRPLPLINEELSMLSIGALLGGILGEMAAFRFSSVLGDSVVLLQNALLFSLIALPTLYFAVLGQSVQPLLLGRAFLLPYALLVGLLGSFLSFGAEPLSLMLCFLLFDAREDEASASALTIALCCMLGKLGVMLIRQRFVLPAADTLIWLLPGALLGAIIAGTRQLADYGKRFGAMLLPLSMFAALLNVLSAAL